MILKKMILNLAAIVKDSSLSVPRRVTALYGADQVLLSRMKCIDSELDIPGV